MFDFEETDEQRSSLRKKDIKEKSDILEKNRASNLEVKKHTTISNTATKTAVQRPSISKKSSAANKFAGFSAKKPPTHT